MKTYRLVTMGSFFLMILAILFPILTNGFNPGIWTYLKGYLTFLLPGGMIVAFLLFLPRISQSMLNILIIGGALFLILCVIFLQASPISIAFYLFATLGLFLIKKKTDFSRSL